MDLTLLLAFVVAAFVLSIVPGPDMLFIVANALVGGPKAGVVAASGVSCGLIVHTVAAAFGLGALITAAPMALDIVRLCGAAFLAYLAITTWLSSRRRTAADVTNDPFVSRDETNGSFVTPRPRSIRRVYLMALLTNVANPKVVLFYLAFLPQFMTTGAHAWAPTVQLLMLGLTLIVVGFAVDASVALLAGTVAHRMLRQQTFRQWLDRVCAAIFGALAVRIATDV